MSTTPGRPGAPSEGRARAMLCVHVQNDRRHAHVLVAGSHTLRAAACLQAVAKSGPLHPYILSCAFPLCSCPCPAGTGFNAAPGWDAATGLGTFNYGRIKAQIVAMGI